MWERNFDDNLIKLTTFSWKLPTISLTIFASCLTPQKSCIWGRARREIMDMSRYIIHHQSNLLIGLGDKLQKIIFMLFLLSLSRAWQPGQEKFDGVTKDIRHAFNICTLQSQPLPDEPLPGFKDCVAQLAKDFKNITNLVLQALALSLEMPMNFFVEKHSHMLDYGKNETTFR